MSGDEGMVFSAADRQKEDLIGWLRATRAEKLEELWHTADETRAQNVGDRVNVWGAIKLSNHCVDRCAFCGLRGDNRQIERYRMDASGILVCARQAASLGCGTVLLQSGRDLQLPDDLANTIRCIRDQTGLKVALSLGERSEAELKVWRQAGADTYLLRFLTANPTLFRLLHQGRIADPRRRLPLLAMIRQLGYQVGSGILVGFPGQSHASLADDLGILRTLDPDVVMVGPYIWPAEFGSWRRSPRSGDANSVQSVLTAVALARQLCPNADIVSGAALSTVGSLEAHGLALQRGANTLILDLTPPNLRDANRCYPGRRALVPEVFHSAPEELAATITRWRSGAVIASNCGQQAERLRIGICMGSSCFSRGNNRLVAALKELLATEGLEQHVLLEGHLCEGFCSDGPNVTIDGEYRHQADPADVIKTIRHHPRLKA